ncbi:MAG: rod shape-determining protein MreD [Desulfuromonadales bacterium C00003068]|jgi:rod shape-determining protein MreD|nr:MAG: rod shape-determining protein MreD [Desulfuromonadales bacterium C00003068]
MKRLVFYLFAAIFLILVQTSTLPLFFGLTLRPDLILLLVLYIGLNESPIAGAFYSWFLGCVLDVFCGMTLGLNGMILLLIFCGTYMVGRQLNLKNDLVMLVATTFGTISNSLLLILTLLFFSEQRQSTTLILNGLPAQLVINLVTVLSVTLLLSAIRTRSRYNKRKTSHQGLNIWH